MQLSIINTDVDDGDDDGGDRDGDGDDGDDWCRRRPDEEGCFPVLSQSLRLGTARGMLFTDLVFLLVARLMPDRGRAPREPNAVQLALCVPSPQQKNAKWKSRNRDLVLFL